MTLDGKIAPPPAAWTEPHCQGLPPADGSRAKRRAPTSSNSVIRAMPSWWDRNDPGRRSAAYRSQRESATASAVARDSGFPSATAVGLAPGAECVSESTSKNDVLVFCSSASKDEKRANWKRAAFGSSKFRSGIGWPPGSSCDSSPPRATRNHECDDRRRSGVNGAALASGVVDKIFLYYAPKILGARLSSIRRGTGSHQPIEATAVQASPLASFRRRLRRGRILARSLRGVRSRHVLRGSAMQVYDGLVSASRSSCLPAS